ncbi:MAG: branched-chain amino acid ABC transporter permease LivH [Candidatus Electryoneaceae bacterium]|nr:branched-chain amino acid ABC transporter permease LivH [Candidatus Electryoneaceae bacterium]
MFLQQLINGLTLGFVYALIALGYTMVYGILELINFAHGEIYMIGAFLGVIGLGLWQAAGLEWMGAVPLIIGLILFAALFSALWGVSIERFAYRPLRNAGRLSPLISALGMSIFLQNFIMIAQGTREKVFPDLFTGSGIDVGTAHISPVQILIFITSTTMMIGLTLLVKKTKIGAAMRATAQDRVMAQLCGINVNNVIALTFAIGSGLAGVAGVLVASYYGMINFYIGYQAGLKAFTAAVLGGIGNLPGAMIGGLILGLVEAFGAGYISSEYKDVYAFVILILLLIFKPGGLLGERVVEKV